jgi:hypothetical protein
VIRKKRVKGDNKMMTTKEFRKLEKEVKRLKKKVQELYNNSNLVYIWKGQEYTISALIIKLMEEVENKLSE